MSPAPMAQSTNTKAINPAPPDGYPAIYPAGAVTIPLTQGYVAIVDELDAIWLAQWKWCASVTAGGRYVYAARRGREDGKFRLIYMHRAITGAARGWDVDHADGNTLHNRRANLRVATRGENTTNSHVTARPAQCPYRGVSKNTRGYRWRAEIGANGAKLRLGSFDTAEDAAAAYNEAARRIYGEFARLNELPSGGQRSPVRGVA